MEKIKIELMIDGEKKTYETVHIPGTIYRKTLKIQEKISKGEITPDVLDELIAFVCNVFDNKFTVEEYWSGVSLKNVLSEIVRVINEVHRIVTGN